MLFQKMSHQQLQQSRQREQSCSSSDIQQVSIWPLTTSHKHSFRVAILQRPLVHSACLQARQQSQKHGHFSCTENVQSSAGTLAKIWKKHATILLFLKRTTTKLQQNQLMRTAKKKMLFMQFIMKNHNSVE